MKHGLNTDLITRRIEIARSIFLEKDWWLLQASAHERAMTHKFAEALQIVFPQWHVDCEYNRDGKYDSKAIDLPEEPDKTVFPDIINHRRNTKENLVIFEAKPTGVRRNYIDYDSKKLKAYLTGGLGYEFGVMLTFITGDSYNVKFEVFTVEKLPI
jgi:hypothetical protein